LFFKSIGLVILQHLPHPVVEGSLRCLFSLSVNSFKSQQGAFKSQLFTLFVRIVKAGKRLEEGIK
jgi:hypothetical protein